MSLSHLSDGGRETHAEAVNLRNQRGPAPSVSVPVLSAAIPLDLGDEHNVLWTRRDRWDPAAARLANRHYSREVVSDQVGGPGFILVFVSPDELACWISKRHAPEAQSPRSYSDLHDGYRCALFRNESPVLASTLIAEAVRMTEAIWGPPPPSGWSTYVRRDKVASVNPGFCFKKAGWTLDREYDHPKLVRLFLREAVRDAS